MFTSILKIPVDVKKKNLAVKQAQLDYKSDKKKFDKKAKRLIEVRRDRG